MVHDMHAAILFQDNYKVDISISKFFWGRFGINKKTTTLAPCFPNKIAKPRLVEVLDLPCIINQ